MSESELLAAIKVLQEVVAVPNAAIEDKQLLVETIHQLLEVRGLECRLKLSRELVNEPPYLNSTLAYVSTFFHHIQSQRPVAEARTLAELAWIGNLPSIQYTDDIGGYIACIAFGIGVDILTPEKGARLLYAAQIARSLSHSAAPTRAPGRPSQQEQRYIEEAIAYGYPPPPGYKPKSDGKSLPNQ